MALPCFDVADLLGLSASRRFFRSDRFRDVKDPSVVHDGEQWHLFATGCGLPTGLEILHATAPSFSGPWTEHAPCELLGVDHVPEAAAPGVAADEDGLHLFLQHGFNVLGGDIEHLVSVDGGHRFTFADSALRSDPSCGEDGIYDPDPAYIDGWPHLTYAAMTVVGEPDLYLARSASGTWSGPWERQGRILAHHEVEYHNQVGDADYEWGLEGPQLVQLPGGGVLLLAVCFLADRAPATRQRVLLAVAEDPCGPYAVLGPVIDPVADGGENGHGAGVLVDGEVRIVYQERHGDGRPWHLRSVSVAGASR